MHDGPVDPVVALVLVPAACLLGLAVLTGVGQRRRVGGVGLSVAAALLFPIAWAGWYVHDRGHAAR